MKRIFHYKDEKSDKMWSIELKGKAYETEYGKTGSKMRSDVNEYESEEEAKKEYEKKIESKIKKGYKEIDAGEINSASSASKDENLQDSKTNNNKEFKIPKTLGGKGGDSLTREQVEEKLKELEFEVVEEVKEFYSTQNGTPGDEHLGLLTLDDAIESSKLDNVGDMFKDFLENLHLFFLTNWHDSTQYAVINKGIFAGNVMWFIPRDKYSSKLAFTSISSMLYAIDSILSDPENLKKDAYDSPSTLLNWGFDSFGGKAQDFDIEKFIEEYDSFTEVKEGEIKWNVKGFYIEFLKQYFDGADQKYKDRVVKVLQKSNDDLSKELITIIDPKRKINNDIISPEIQTEGKVDYIDKDVKVEIWGIVKHELVNKYLRWYKRKHKSILEDIFEKYGERFGVSSGKEISKNIKTTQLIISAGAGGIIIKFNSIEPFNGKNYEFEMRYENYEKGLKYGLSYDNISFRVKEM